MDQFSKDAYVEGKKVRRLIDSDEKLIVVMNIFEMINLDYEQFSYEIMQFYKRYNKSVPCFIKQVNKENMHFFGIYFIHGLLYE
ncbi:hypothetical protein [Lentibacillus cibarius]|uniref:Uncharacterized protein n=1 Tax=Lentibacillus cibarius TaxID=2583219 RepID=A0A5S3QJD2_9BACI|nr:hypothetical protein [Lentibacillus cibarius]TMN21837.1 hypothetical protein FFL34_06710 [Lentibacillus cibarius]